MWTICVWMREGDFFWRGGSGGYFLEGLGFSALLNIVLPQENNLNR